MTTTQLKIGDRVHFKETPTMLGTVECINEQGKYGVSWDITNPHQSKPGPIPFYPKQHLTTVNERKKRRGNPNFSNRETNPAVIKSNNHPVFPGVSCETSATVQIPAKVKNLVCKANGTGMDENLYRKIQFLIRKHALNVSGCKSWEEFNSKKLD